MFYILDLQITPLTADGRVSTILFNLMVDATKALDPAVFAGVIGLLFGVVAAACLLPAWRASRIQPATVLRSEFRTWLANYRRPRYSLQDYWNFGLVLVQPQLAKPQLIERL